MQEGSQEEGGVVRSEGVLLSIVGAPFFAFVCWWCVVHIRGVTGTLACYRNVTHNRSMN